MPINKLITNLTNRIAFDLNVENLEKDFLIVLAS